jgi:hypothetical protein
MSNLPNRNKSKYDEKVRQLRKLSRAIIPELLSDRPLTSKELLLQIEKRFPEYCNPKIICKCNNNIARPEWQHQALWAIQDSKSYKHISFDKVTKRYYKI